jgi:hypothetical protein
LTRDLRGGKMTNKEIKELIEKHIKKLLKKRAVLRIFTGAMIKLTPKIPTKMFLSSYICSL